MHTEIEWLRRGPKARTTKSKARIDKAHRMIGELAEMNARTRAGAAEIDFSASKRQTKQLIRLDGVTHVIGDACFSKILISRLPRACAWGWSVRTAAARPRCFACCAARSSRRPATIRKADSLRIVYFDQNRQLDPDVSLRRALAPDSDSVIYQDRVIHVASWAARFFFAGEDLNRPVGRLSGGERARVLIAQLMLQPADVLLLDEPTNDLDIPTLEILEESLLEYRGALVLVTHDRYMLDRVSTIVLGLDGSGAAERFADYSQWEQWLRSQPTKPIADAPARAAREHPRSRVTQREPVAAKRQLSHAENREFASIEKRIAKAEEELQAKRAALENPEIASDATRLHEAYAQMEAAQKAVDELYARWGALDQKKLEHLEK